MAATTDHYLNIYLHAAWYRGITFCGNFWAMFGNFAALCLLRHADWHLFSSDNQVWHVSFNISMSALFDILVWIIMQHLIVPLTRNGRRRRRNHRYCYSHTLCQVQSRVYCRCHFATIMGRNLPYFYTSIPSLCSSFSRYYKICICFYTLFSYILYYYLLFYSIDRPFAFYESALLKRRNNTAGSNDEDDEWRRMTALQEILSGAFLLLLQPLQAYIRQLNFHFLFFSVLSIRTKQQLYLVIFA